MVPTDALGPTEGRDGFPFKTQVQGFPLLFIVFGPSGMVTDGRRFQPPVPQQAVNGSNVSQWRRWFTSRWPYLGSFEQKD